MPNTEPAITLGLARSKRDIDVMISRPAAISPTGTIGKHAGTHIAVASTMRAIATLLCATLPLVAHAEPPPLPPPSIPPSPWFAGVDLTVGYGGRLESFHYERRVEPGVFFARGPWLVVLSMPWAALRSDDVDRDSRHLGDFALGGRVAYRVPVSGSAVATLALGAERHWLYGHDEVLRTCHVAQTCIAGFYIEKPSYRAWVPQLRVGIGFEQIRWSRIRSIALDLIVERYDLDVPPDGVSGILVLGGITGMIGRGP